MIITIDFETYYDKAYSLTRMSEVDYILDPRFEVIMCSMKLGDRPTEVYVGEKAVNTAFSCIDWSKHAVLAHNMRFDGAILAWRFGIVPGLYLDTLGMANAITRPLITYGSLAKLAAYYGLEAKGTTVQDMMGRTLASLSVMERTAYANYCAHDTDLCRAIFDKFIKVFPASELRVLDLSLRMFTQPQARLNPNKLAEYLNLVQAEKAASFARMAHIPEEVFSSNIKFAELLRSYGVEPPMKTSPATGQPTFALAKNDREFKDLCADPDIPLDAQVALAVRLGAKSTIDETRTLTLLKLASWNWGLEGEAWMPVPYKYYGAHTGRFSGDGGYNFANLRRGSPIRDAIEAPDGFRVVHRDSSQIEARMVAWLAGCDKLVKAFREGRDVYSEFAWKFYGREITRADTLERFTGKTAILSLGYGAGHVKFRHALYIGNGGVSVALDMEEAVKLVDFYREEYAPIKQLWWRGNAALKRMINPRDVPDPGIPAIEIGAECVYLPNGMAISYPDLKEEPDDGVWGRKTTYRGVFGGPRKIYGAKFIENITQGLARIVVTDIMLHVDRDTGHRPFMSTYDSHDYIVPESEARDFDAVLERAFAVAPTWAPDLPLASEGGWGRTLLEAEKGVNQ
jgi:DNA polymerase